MLSWITLTLLASLTWAIVQVARKYILKHEMHDIELSTTIAGLTLFLLFGVIALLKGSIELPIIPLLISVGAGIAYVLALYYTHKGFSRAEVSRGVALGALQPLFVVLLAFFLLGEQFTALTYLGILFLTAGAVLLSIKKFSWKVKLRRAALYLIMAALAYAVRTILVKYATAENIWAPLFWLGVGGWLVSSGLLIHHHPKIQAQAAQGIKHLTIVYALVALAFLFFVLALEQGPATLTTALSQITVLFVFIGATTISYFHPQIIHEKITRKALLTKGVAILLILVGVALII